MMTPGGYIGVSVSGQELPACVTVIGRPPNVSTMLLGDPLLFGHTKASEIAREPTPLVTEGRPTQKTTGDTGGAVYTH